MPTLLLRLDSRCKQQKANGNRSGLGMTRKGRKKMSARSKRQSQWFLSHVAWKGRCSPGY